MKTIDFTKLLVGTKVWNIARGWGKIIDIETDAVDNHPIKVIFVCDEENSEYFTKDGKEFTEDKNPSLYLNSFEIPERAFEPPIIEDFNNNMIGKFIYIHCSDDTFRIGQIFQIDYTKKNIKIRCDNYPVDLHDDFNENTLYDFSFSFGWFNSNMVKYVKFLNIEKE